MASSTHRKLLLFPNSTDIPNPTVQTCLIFCNTQKNDTVSTAPPGFCPPACLDICPSTCHHSLFSLLPPDNSLPHPNNPHNLSPLLISMLILLATGFLSITFYLIYTKFYSRFSNTTQTRRNNNNNNNTRTRGRSDFLDEEHGPNTMVFHPIWYIPTVGLNPTVINSIKVCTYENEKGAMEEIIRVKDCAVCLGEFVKGDELRVLPKCNHAFHIHCIDTWLKSHVTCPLCRAPIIIIIPPDHHDHAQQTTGEGEVSTMVDAAAAGSEDGGDHENNVVEGCLEEDGDKEGRLLGSSSSQKWSFQRGAASLVGRSLSCSGKIFSSRFNDNQPSPDS